MKNTLTVGELIDQLRGFNLEDEVILYYIGFTTEDSYEVDLDLGGETVDKFNGKVRIAFT